MKKSNIKFIVRVLELFTIIITIILTLISISYANTFRGCSAMGGEYLIPILGAIVVMILETILEESEARKNEH